MLALVPWVLARTAVALARHRARVGQAVAVTAITLVLLEGALRLFNYAVPTFLFSPTPTTATAAGLRALLRRRVQLARLQRRRADHRAAARRPRGRHRRLVRPVGVVPRRDNYLTLVEQALAADGPAEVVNLGVSGTEPRDYLSLLVDEGLGLDPDLVLVGFFVGNDFEVRRRQLHSARMS
ncbi:MAG: hypothetical protein R2708_27860 [Vicinamibacterales bacterium]